MLKKISLSNHHLTSVSYKIVYSFVICSMNCWRKEIECWWLLTCRICLPMTDSVGSAVYLHSSVKFNDKLNSLSMLGAFCQESVRCSDGDQINPCLNYWLRSCHYKANTDWLNLFRRQQLNHSYIWNVHRLKMTSSRKTITIHRIRTWHWQNFNLKPTES